MKKLKRVVASMLALSCINLVACEKDGDSYKVTLKFGDEILDTIDVDKATQLDIPDAPTKAGYTFEGWYIDAELTREYTPDVLSANLTLYAKFTPNTMYINLKGLDGATTGLETNRVAVKKGEEYTLPTPTRPGFTFVRWELDGDAFATSGTFELSNSVNVVARWEKSKYTVTFKNNGKEVATQTNIEHGKTAVKVDTWDNFPAGYEYAGTYTDEACTKAYDFATPVTGAMTLYVKTQPKMFKINVNADGDTPLDKLVKYGEMYELPETPTREGYIFKGYTLNDAEFVCTGTYTYTTDITVVANWEKDPAFGKSTVSFYDGETEIDSLVKVVEDGTTLTAESLIDAPNKAGYTFAGWYADKELTTEFADTVINKDITIYAKYTANPYKITVNFDGGTEDDQSSATLKEIDVVYGETFELPANPVKNGYTFEGYVYNNKAFTAGTYTYAENITITATWKRIGADAEEEGTDLFLAKGTYFKERSNADDVFTYVFVTGMKYDFNSYKNLEVIGAGSTLTKDGLSFTTVSAHDGIILRFTKEVGGGVITYERPAKIVDQVETFDGGNDYLSSWGANVDRTLNFQDASKTVAATRMAVGKSNYIPDMQMFNDKDEALSFDRANVVMTVTDDGVETNDYTFENGAITFGSSIAADSEVNITYSPKYTINNQKLTVRLTVNDGVNVYNDEQLRTAFRDANVHQINMLRNITATVAPEDLIAEHNMPINEYGRAIYARNVSTTGDSITVNGNFFKVDGSKLPLMNNDLTAHGANCEKDENGEYKCRIRDDWQESNPAYYVPNMQLGIFQYKCETSEDLISHEAAVAFNDLYITGNFTKDAGHTTRYGDRELLTQSGAYHGIVLRGGQATLNNTTVINTNIALFSGSDLSSTGNTGASKWFVNNSKMTHSWGNQMYLYDLSDATFVGCYLGDCGGAAITLDDIAYDKATTDVKTSVTLDATTKIENYIVGTEAYFVSRGMSDLAIQMKTMLEQGISTETGGACTVIKSIGGVDTFNLAILVRSSGSDTSEWLADAQGKPDMTLVTPYMFYPQGGLYNGYFIFDTKNPNDPVNYMFGYVEVRVKGQ